MLGRKSRRMAPLEVALKGRKSQFWGLIWHKSFLLNRQPDLSLWSVWRRRDTLEELTDARKYTLASTRKRSEHLAQGNIREHEQKSTRIILYAELILTKAEGNMMPWIFGSSHFNEEPVRVSIVKTNVFIRSINNLYLWIELQVQDKYVSSQGSGLHWAILADLKGTVSYCQPKF